MPGRVAIILKGYPRLSETFIANEIRGLEARGLEAYIISLRRPTDPDAHPVHREIAAPVVYMPEYLSEAPVRVWRGWRSARQRPGYRLALRTWLRDLRRDPTPNRARRWGQALVLAAELPPDVDRLHAHFLHTPSSVARYAAAILDMPWSASGHAIDIWTTPDWDLAAKLDDCAWVATCSQAGYARLAARARDADKIALIYHGIDPRRFPPRGADPPARDGASPDDPIVLLAVGRAVEKKGFDVLLEALARLPAGLNWRLVHTGDGPLLGALRSRASALGLTGRITWCGAVNQSEILGLYREADLFILPSRVARNGDRDGLPNVLLEAQSQALCCIASDVAGVPELIVDGVTGILVAVDDAKTLSDAIARLAGDPSHRRALARAGEGRVHANFSFDHGIDRLAERFGLTSLDEASPACASLSMRR